MATPSRQKKPPHVAVIVLGAVASLALGSLFALGHLVARPVEVVTTKPKDAQEGVRYFVQGVSGGGSGWERKFEHLANGAGEVGLTEGELNSWSSATLREAKPEEANLSGPFKIVAGVPNFRFDGDALQIGAVNKFNFLGNEAPLVLQAKGKFERSGDEWRFQPSEAYLGGLPLHRMPVLMSLVMARFGAKDAVPEPVRKVLARASHLAVEKGELVVRVQ